MYSSQILTGDLVVQLYLDKRTVFKVTDIAMLTGESNPGLLTRKLIHAARTGKIQNPRRGIYTKPGYNPEELAVKLYPPSYLSLQYVLERAGVIFQYAESITAISYLSREVEVDKRIIKFRKCKQQILYDWKGIGQSDQGVFRASPERAFLDLCYLEPDYHFDNLNPLDRKLVVDLLPVFSSPTLTKRVLNLIGS